MSLPHNTQIIMSGNEYVDLGDWVSSASSCAVDASRTLHEISIQSWNFGTKQLQHETAFLASCYKQDLVKLIFEDGTTQKCSPNHKWFCGDVDRYVYASNAVGRAVLVGRASTYLAPSKIVCTSFELIGTKKVVDVTVCAGVYTLYDVMLKNSRCDGNASSGSVNNNCLVWNAEAKGYLVSAADVLRSEC